MLAGRRSGRAIASRVTNRFGSVRATPCRAKRAPSGLRSPLELTTVMGSDCTGAGLPEHEGPGQGGRRKGAEGSDGDCEGEPGAELDGEGRVCSLPTMT